jgi:hypothetical protein
MTGQGGFGKGGWTSHPKFPQFIGKYGEFDAGQSRIEGRF